ncbi:PucR family transcriptional regulator [Paucisalibacillus globulus]|uniref:PucR family transcriptional regulator n=1 Tax=Paucisalibacillus globulus TaxID=351095 RepID=UPI001C3E882B|nr:helix-turn-helix domain-containing protein [Paucisalibacillus globulus]
MIDKLKKYFPSLQHYETVPTDINLDFKWFQMDNGQLVGIHPSELEEKDLVLLHTLLKPYENHFPILTEDEQRWKQWIKMKDGHPRLNRSYRLVYFKIPSNQIQPQEFKEAINQLFEKETTILWENKSEGVIVEYLRSDLEEEISYTEIIDILMSDLYINIQFFVGPYLSTLDGIKEHYEQLISGALTALTYSEKSVVSYIEAIPYLLMEQVSPQFKEELNHLILQDFTDDVEFIKMIEVFLESNLNISVAAKKLYMHRNSLQYRIDKFHENTGIDIRVFQQALTVYLALISRTK